MESMKALMASKLNILFVAACLCSVIGRCNSFKQTKRRFGPRRLVSGRSVGPFTNYYFTARGGDISDELEGTFSQFIDSFESELSEIRREAEIEAEMEMQKLLGLVDKSRKVHVEDEMDDGFVEGQQVTREEEIERFYEDGEESEAEDAHYSDAQDSTIDETEEQFDEIEESATEREDESVNEQDSPVLPQNEEDIYDLDEQSEQETFSEDGDDTTDLVDKEELQLAVSEEISQDIMFETDDAEPTLSVDIVSDDNEMEIVPEIKPERLHKSKSKKTRASKSKKKRKVQDDIQVVDQGELYYGDKGLSTISTTVDKEMQRTPKGLQYYLHSDLVRAVVLFVATVAVSIWLQRLQRQMEAQGI
jgi:hypothetical protein